MEMTEAMLRTALVEREQESERSAFEDLASARHD
jgi:hypothetical protein